MPDEVNETVHLLIPGRGRSADGMGLSEQSLDRVEAAAKLYIELGLKGKGGRIICSGYKTPGDRKGVQWMDGQDTFVGVPEAMSMKQCLIELGIPEEVISVEYHSVDTVTNFVRSERGGYFGTFGDHPLHKTLDHRPVAIIAQKSHLLRMIEVIAPRTLQRRYIGIAIPEQSEKKNVDN